MQIIKFLPYMDRTLHSDEQYARQVQMSEVYSNPYTGVPIVVGLPVSNPASNACIATGTPVQNFGLFMPPTDFSAVIRLSWVTRLICLFDIFLISWTVVMGAPLAAVFLPLPAFGYFGAIRYRRPFLIAYMIFNFIMIGLRTAGLSIAYGEIGSIAAYSLVLGILSNLGGFAITFALYMRLRALSPERIAELQSFGY